MSGSLVFFTFIIIVFAGVVKLFIPLNPSKTGKNPENIFLDTKLLKHTPAGTVFLILTGRLSYTGKAGNYAADIRL